MGSTRCSGGARRRLIAALAVIGGFCQSANGADWLRAETDHFVIYSDVGRSATREYLEQLEAFKFLSEMLLGSGEESAARTARFTIYLLEDRDDLRVVRPDFHQYVAGVYLHCIEGAQAYAYQPPTALGEQEAGLRVLLHEYAHHVMYSRLRGFYPAWYVEGFAEYLSTVSLRGNVYSIGASQQERLLWLESASRVWIGWDVMLDPKRFAEAVKAKQVDSLQFYAQAWLLAHYMLSDSDRVKGFNQYFESVGRGEDALPAFEAATGMTAAKLDKALRAHMRRLPGMRVKVPQLPEAAVRIAELPKEQGDYLLSASVNRTCPAQEQGKHILESLRAMKAKHDRETAFRIELSRAELLFGDRESARKELELLVKQEPSNFDVLYLLGRSYYEAAQTSDAQRADLMTKASREFLIAYRLDKLYAPNLYFLAKSLDDYSTPSKAVVNSAMGAAVLAPSVFEYAMHAATISLRAGDREAAVHVLQPFASNPHSPELAGQVAAMIDAIRDGKDLPEVMDTISEKPAE
ncbi:hypothetical protein HNQ60_002737 [Povalibacter uvarum]|uniref:DUF1570 domain-containing protein n=1 Tax=Povalibacter uvarum TaxID=732238 RepID=A0A841HLV8_9GAMM|nr:hypothetical protein [Povalibacter uvarum]MBB6093856.1 hypothetical protein [Povalibacter uvarum]